MDGHVLEAAAVLERKVTPSSSFASYPLESLNSVPSSPSSTSLPTTTAFSGPGSNPKPFPTLPYSAATDSLQPNHSALPDMSSDLQTRELAFAAKQYSSCCTASPDDSNYDMLYNHGLVLQELAARLIPGSTEQVVMLQEACEKYESALSHQPSSHAALYNWGVALTDLARCVRDRPDQARACLNLASHKYAEALSHQPGSVQALNNWGLVLQELSISTHNMAERDQLVRFAVEKFRHAIRLRPNFDRGCYNLGTVYYTHACALQAELVNQFRGLPVGSASSEAMKLKQQREAEISVTFTTAAQYICLAFALQQQKEIYRKSLGVVKSMLPLPFIRAGFLKVVETATCGGPNETWHRELFVLDHESLHSASHLETSLSTAATGLMVTPQLRSQAQTSQATAPLLLHLSLQDIVTVRRCADACLPVGESFLIQLETPSPSPTTSTSSSAPFSSSVPAVIHPLAGIASMSSSGSHSVPVETDPTLSTHDTSSVGSPGVGPEEQTEFERGTATAAAAAAAAAARQARGVRVSGGGEALRDVFLVAEDAESADAWVDALLLCSYMVTTRSPQVLAHALAPKTRLKS
ncbi:MAG: hypothetical protein WDW38_001130 [Sanguina aurantia]